MKSTTKDDEVALGRRSQVPKYLKEDAKLEINNSTAFFQVHKCNFCTEETQRKATYTCGFDETQGEPSDGARLH